MIDATCFRVALVICVAAFFASLLAAIRPGEKRRRIAVGLTALSMLGSLTALVLRWLHAGRPPFQTLYESLTLAAFCLLAATLVAEILYRPRFVAATGTLLALSCMGFAVTRNADVRQLPPALQSGWFIPHVVIYFVGYGAVGVSYLAALLTLFTMEKHRRWAGFVFLAMNIVFPLACLAVYFARRAGWMSPDVSFFTGTIFVLFVLLTSAQLNPLLLRLMERMKLFERLARAGVDRLAEPSARFAFAFLTLGLLAGAVWAEQAWGDYWAWDIKEVWSLITWLIYAAYLHLLYTQRGRAKSPLTNWFLVAGFAAVVFTYLGMGLLPSAHTSEHTYQ